MRALKILVFEYQQDPSKYNIIVGTTLAVILCLGFGWYLISALNNPDISVRCTNILTIKDPFSNCGNGAICQTTLDVHCRLRKDHSGPHISKNGFCWPRTIGFELGDYHGTPSN